MNAPTLAFAPRDGSELYNGLLSNYQQSDSALKEDDKTRGILQDLIHSATSRAAAVYYSVYGEGRKNRPSFAQVKELLAQTMPDKSEAELRQAFFQSIKQHTKTITFTPHPTDVLTPKAIEAEKVFLDLLLSNEAQELLKGNQKVENILTQDGPLQHKLQQAIQGMHEALQEQPKAAMTIKEEMERSRSMAGRVYDSAPIIAARAAMAAYGDRTERLSNEELLSFEGMISLQTWSPGDQDNKWQSRAHRIRRGVKVSKVEIKQRYVGQLIGLITELQEKEGAEEAIAELKANTSKIVESFKDPERFVDILEKYPDHGVLLKEIRDQSNGEAYRNMSELQEELMQFRTQHNDLFASQKNPFGEDTPLTTLDGFLVQVMNFKDHLLKVQIRQNQEDIGGTDKKTGAMDVIKKFLVAKKLITEEQANDPHQLLEAVYTNPKVGYNLRKWLKQIGETQIPNQDGNTAGQQDLQTAYRNNPYFSPDTENPAITAPDEHGISIADKFVAYHIMKTMEVANKHPDSIPNFIIAEAQKPQDMLNSLFIAKATMQEDRKYTNEDVVRKTLEKTAKLSAEKQEALQNDSEALKELTAQVVEELEAISAKDLSTRHPKFEIYPLFEHYNDIIAAPETMKEVFKNPYFKAQQASMNKPVMIYDPLTGTERPKTVADRKRELGGGLEPQAGDEKKELSYKRLMFAGSDSFKGGGVFMEPLISDVQYKLERGLLEEGYEAYIEEGAGNAVYRKQPVNASDETVQGNALRWHPIEAAVRATRRIAELVMKSVESLFKINGTAEQLKGHAAKIAQQASEKTLFQVNHSRMEHLRDSNPSLWNEVLGRCEHGTQTYQKLYESTAYNDMLSLASASAFGKMIAYAARKSQRARASSNKADVTQYPQATDTENQRAISYGMALMNTAHHLYYGMEAFATQGAEPLTTENIQQYARKVAKIYEQSPNIQNSINRATYGVMMADMKNAWKFADLGIERNDSGTVSIKQGTQTRTATIETLANATVDSDVLSFINDPAQRNAIISIAKIDYEHQKAKMLLKEVYRVMSPNKVGNTLEQLAPKPVVNEIQDILGNIAPAREHLAVIHQELKDGRRILPKKGDIPNQEDRFQQGSNPQAEFDEAGRITAGIVGPAQTYDDIYYQMAQIKNGFERPLTSMQYPEHAADLHKVQQQAIAV